MPELRLQRVRLIGACLIAVGACAPAEDKPEASQTFTPVPGVAPAASQTMAVYRPGQWIEARAFEFSGYGSSRTLMSVKNEDRQEWIGATVPSGSTGNECAQAALEAAQEVGISGTRVGPLVRFDKNRVSILSMEGCSFRPHP